MKLKVMVGARQSDYWREVREVELNMVWDLKSHRLQLFRWSEPHADGVTERVVAVDVDRLAELISELAKMLTTVGFSMGWDAKRRASEKRAREQREREAAGAPV